MNPGIMPKQLIRVRTFSHRTEVAVQGDQWKPVGGDPGTLDQQVNDWISKEKCQIQQVSPPNVSVYAAGDKGDKRIVFTSVTVTYLAAIEQHNEQTYGRQAGQLGFASPGTDPGNTAISAKATIDGVSAGAGERVRGTSAFPNIGRP